MNKYRELLPVAIALAVQAHGGVINKDETPYILHPLRLMMQADGYGDKIVAILHDTIEDTPLSLADLEAAGFPAEIVLAVDALSKRPDEAGEAGYAAAIERIAVNPLATRVKLLDLQDNIDVTRLPELGPWELARTAKYHRAIQRLRGAVTAHQTQRLEITIHAPDLLEGRSMEAFVEEFAGSFARNVAIQDALGGSTVT